MLHYLVWTVRMAMCKHQWELKEMDVCPPGYVFSTRRSVSATCTQCGWHRSYWKYEGNNQ